MASWRFRSRSGMFSSAAGSITLAQDCSTRSVSTGEGGRFAERATHATKARSPPRPVHVRSTNWTADDRPWTLGRCASRVASHAREEAARRCMPGLLDGRRCGDRRSGRQRDRRRRWGELVLREGGRGEGGGVKRGAVAGWDWRQFPHDPLVDLKRESVKKKREGRVVEGGRTS